MPFNTGLFVDALGRGEPPPDDGDFAELGAILAAWRDDLTAGLDDVVVPPAPRPAAPRPPAKVFHLNSARRRSRMWIRLRPGSAAAVAASLVLFGGVAVGSWHSTPASPLWPVAQALYPDHTDTVLIEQTIGRARAAIEQRHPELAAQLINLARHQLADADLPEETAEPLRAAIDALVLDLVRVLTPPPRPPAQPATPTATPSPVGPPPTTAPSVPHPTSKPHPASPKPSPTGGGGLLPHLPLPDLPLLPSPRSSPIPSPSTEPAPAAPAPAPAIPDVPVGGEGEDGVPLPPLPSLPTVGGLLN